MDIRSKRFLFLYAKSLLNLKYRRTYLGFFWNFLEPALFLIVLSVVFSVVNQMKISDYAVYLFSALIPWRYFEKVVYSNMESLVGGEWLLKKIQVSPLVFPIAQWILAMMEFLFSFIVVFFIFAFIKESWTFHLMILPLALIPWSLLGLGAGLMASVFYVFFRDIKPVIQMAVLFIFFSSPILFRADLFPDNSLQAAILSWHPITYFVFLFQKPIYFGTWPSSLDWGVSFGIGSLFFAAGYFLFVHFRKRFYFYL